MTTSVGMTSPYPIGVAHYVDWATALTENGKLARNGTRGWIYILLYSCWPKARSGTLSRSWLNLGIRTGSRFEGCRWRSFGIS